MRLWKLHGGALYGVLLRIGYFLYSIVSRHRVLGRWGCHTYLLAKYCELFGPGFGCGEGRGWEGIELACEYSGDSLLSGLMCGEWRLPRWAIFPSWYSELESPYCTLVLRNISLARYEHVQYKAKYIDWWTNREVSINESLQVLWFYRKHPAGRTVLYYTVQCSTVTILRKYRSGKYDDPRTPYYDGTGTMDDYVIC